MLKKISVMSPDYTKAMLAVSCCIIWMVVRSIGITFMVTRVIACKLALLDAVGLTYINHKRTTMILVLVYCSPHHLVKLIFISYIQKQVIILAVGQQTTLISSKALAQKKINALSLVETSTITTWKKEAAPLMHTNRGGGVGVEKKYKPLFATMAISTIPQGGFCLRALLASCLLNV